MRSIKDLENRRASLFTTTISGDIDGDAYVLGKNLVELVKKNTFSYIVASMLLGKEIKSKLTAEFIDLVLKTFVDHGPYVSGAVNTMITARAGKDLVSSLVTGLLTIGPRFGGAINGAAAVWLSGVIKNQSAADTVEEFAKRKEYIQGIGHRKYRLDMPDPRVKLIKTFAAKLKKDARFLKFASEVEIETSSKKPNLILNMDGAVAAVMLDILEQEEKMKVSELSQLVEIEFFNALFVLSRAVGFTSHYLDQRRLGEKLFRLSNSDVLSQQ